MKLISALIFLFLQALSFESLGQGMCSREDQSIFGYNQSFISSWRTCGIQHWGNGRATADCLMSRFPDLSTTCGSCFGAFTSCGKRNCESKCLFDSTSSACIQCGLNNCGPAWEMCSGASVDLISEQ